MTKKIAPLLLATIALLAAACGDDDDASAPDSTQPEGSGPAATEPASTEPAATEPAGTASGATTPPATGDCALDTPLKIGFAADLGELGAFSDQPGSEAAQVQVDLVNEAGGVGGLPVEYVVKDIQGDPAATQRAAQELLDDGVNAIIGPPFANTGTPLLDTVDGQAPIIYMASTDPQLADPSRGALPRQLQRSGAVGGCCGVRDRRRGSRRRSRSRPPTTSYFSGNPAYFTETFEQAGGTLVQDFSFSLADEDFSSQVNEMAGLDPAPQALYTAMVMPQIATLAPADGRGRARRRDRDRRRRLRRHRCVECGRRRRRRLLRRPHVPVGRQRRAGVPRRRRRRRRRDRDDQLRRTRLGLGADPRPRRRDRMLGRSRHADLPRSTRSHLPSPRARSPTRARTACPRRTSSSSPSTGGEPALETTMRPTYIPEP